MSADFDYYLRALNDECDGEIDLDRIKAKEPIPHPCALCGWSLDGHKYMYGADPAHFHPNNPPKNKNCTVHLSCQLILKGAALSRAEERIRELEGQLPGLGEVGDA